MKKRARIPVPMSIRGAKLRYAYRCGWHSLQVAHGLDLTKDEQKAAWLMGRGRGRRSGAGDKRTFTTCLNGLERINRLVRETLYSPPDPKIQARFGNLPQKAIADGAADLFGALERSLPTHRLLL